jgi:predicted CXXCH cytochrome family protein
MSATDPRIRRASALSLLAALPLFVLLASGEGPGGTGVPQEGHPAGGLQVDCLRCHESMREELERRVPHQPAFEQKCAECHAPHAARYEHLLNQRERALCFSCHQEEKLEFMRGSVHTPVREGNCTGCHEVHGAEHDGLVKAEGNDLCLSCHTDMVGFASLPSVHPPFVDGECLNCHEAHNSPNENQLAAPAEKLCTICHAVDEARIVEAHNGIPVRGTRCGSCHEPHASVSAGLLLPIVHEPFAGGQCDMCHMVDSDTPTLTMATGGRLCNVCHQDYPRKDDPSVHAPVAEGNCGGCHLPHASKEKGLLTGDVRATCLRCHEEIHRRAETSRSAHPASVEGGACTICHLPHSSKEEWLLKAGPIRTCLPCHPAQRHGHPLGADRKDPRTGEGITCVTCHDVHGTDFPMQLRGDQSRGLCVECHADAGGGGGGGTR